MKSIIIYFFTFINLVTSYAVFSNRAFNTKMTIANKITDFPKLNYQELTEQDKYDLQWYVIGKK